MEKKYFCPGPPELRGEEVRDADDEAGGGAPAAAPPPGLHREHGGGAAPVEARVRGHCALPRGASVDMGSNIMCYDDIQLLC